MNRINKWLGAGGEEHRQTYRAWREYPAAMRLAMLNGLNIGLLVAGLVWWISRP